MVIGTFQRPHHGGFSRPGELTYPLLTARIQFSAGSLKTAARNLLPRHSGPPHGEYRGIKDLSSGIRVQSFLEASSPSLFLYV